MAESLLLPVVRGVAGKAAGSLVQSVTRMWGVDDTGRKLLADAELRSEANPGVKRWMKDHRAVAHEADDALDDFQYEALRRAASCFEDNGGLTSSKQQVQEWEAIAGSKSWEFAIMSIGSTNEILSILITRHAAVFYLLCSLPNGPSDGEGHVDPAVDSK